MRMGRTIMDTMSTGGDITDMGMGMGTGMGITGTGEDGEHLPPYSEAPPEDLRVGAQQPPGSGGAVGLGALVAACDAVSSAMGPPEQLPAQQAVATDATGSQPEVAVPQKRKRAGKKTEGADTGADPQAGGCSGGPAKAGSRRKLRACDSCFFRKLRCDALPNELAQQLNTSLAQVSNNPTAASVYADMVTCSACKKLGSVCTFTRNDSNSKTRVAIASGVLQGAAAGGGGASSAGAGGPPGEKKARKIVVDVAQALSATAVSAIKAVIGGGGPGASSSSSVAISAAVRTAGSVPVKSGHAAGGAIRVIAPAGNVQEPGPASSSSNSSNHGIANGGASSSNHNGNSNNNNNNALLSGASLTQTKNLEDRIVAIEAFMRGEQLQRRLKQGQPYNNSAGVAGGGVHLAKDPPSVHDRRGRRPSEADADGDSKRPRLHGPHDASPPPLTASTPGPLTAGSPSTAGVGSRMSVSMLINAGASSSTSSSYPHYTHPRTAALAAQTPSSSIASSPPAVVANATLSGQHHYLLSSFTAWHDCWSLVTPEVPQGAAASTPGSGSVACTPVIRPATLPGLDTGLKAKSDEEAGDAAPTDAAGLDAGASAVDLPDSAQPSRDSMQVDTSAARADAEKNEDDDVILGRKLVYLFFDRMHQHLPMTILYRPNWVRGDAWRHQPPTLLNAVLALACGLQDDLPSELDREARWATGDKYFDASRGGIMEQLEDASPTLPLIQTLLLLRVYSNIRGQFHRGLMYFSLALRRSELLQLHVDPDVVDADLPDIEKEERRRT
ncbi:hypothetical protein HK101_003133, partial [Irineochytrium annulatum]